MDLASNLKIRKYMEFAKFISLLTEGRLGYLGRVPPSRPKHGISRLLA
jgi:hypothetical protein